MAEVWVTNASPVIVLAKIGRLSIISDLSDETILPEAVAAEIMDGPPDDPARAAVSAGWGLRVSPKGYPASLVERELGRGETSVIAVALEHMPCTVLLDDATARAAARAFGLPMIGTLGLVARAKSRGLIASASEVIRELKDAGLYLADGVLGTVLRRIGETWP